MGLRAPARAPALYGGDSGKSIGMFGGICYSRTRSPMQERSQHMTVKDQLAALRRFLEALESSTEYRRNGVDLKPRLIEIFKREIAYLETVLRRGGANR